MDKRKQIIRQFQLRSILFLSLAAVCFGWLLTFVHQPFGGLTAWQQAITIGFWVGIAGFYAAFTVFQIQFKPYKQAKGNRAMIIPALAFISFGLYRSYRQFIVADGMGWYETFALLVGWVTLGATAFIVVVILFVRLNFKRQGKKF